MARFRTVGVMTWMRRASILLLPLALVAACPSDDGDDAANDSGSTPTTSPTADDGSAGDDSAAELGCAAGVVGETTDGAANSLMETWGAPCTTDQDCIDLIGDPLAICDQMAVVYELPGGYCTKECELPDLETTFINDAEECDPNGGVGCFGVMGMFARCGLFCTDDAQCTRDGYICRQMPLIAQEGDPRSCLMPDCCQESCAE